jgi:excisionase family DNA binding protein
MHQVGCQPPTTPAYVRLEGAAEYLGVPPRQVRHLVDRREIPHSKVGRYLVFSYRELDEWVASRRRDSVAS